MSEWAALVPRDHSDGQGPRVSREHAPKPPMCRNPCSSCCSSNFAQCTWDSSLDWVGPAHSKLKVGQIISFTDSCLCSEISFTFACSVRWPASVSLVPCVPAGLIAARDMEVIPAQAQVTLLISKPFSVMISLRDRTNTSMADKCPAAARPVGRVKTVARRVRWAATK